MIRVKHLLISHVECSMDMRHAVPLHARLRTKRLSSNRYSASLIQRTPTNNADCDSEVQLNVSLLFESCLIPIHKLQPLCPLANAPSLAHANRK